MAHSIPSGSHTITPHLIVKRAVDAIDKRAFGAEELRRLPYTGPEERGQEPKYEIGS
jgi:uncharacterized glyoxalase superfamily protein PhnB